MRSGLLTIAIALLFTVPGFAKDYKIGMIHWIAYSPLNVADVKRVLEGTGAERGSGELRLNQEWQGLERDRHRLRHDGQLGRFVDERRAPQDHRRDGLEQRRRQDHRQEGLAPDSRCCR